MVSVLVWPGRSARVEQEREGQPRWILGPVLTSRRRRESLCPSSTVDASTAGSVVASGAKALMPSRTHRGEERHAVGTDTATASAPVSYRAPRARQSTGCHRR